MIFTEQRDKVSEPAPLREMKTKAASPPFWIPLVILIVASLIIRMGRFDEGIQKMFWDSRYGWDLDNQMWVQIPYFFGTIPAAVAGFAAAGYWLVCALQRRRDWSRRLSALLVALMLIGPGLLVNLLFKEHYGRPRPSEVQEFGGDKVYKALGEANFQVSGRSFPSGHASMGFFWLGLFVFLWNRNRKWAWFFCALGLVHGVIMGLGRMMQGSHWLSDVLWSAGFVYFTAWALNRWLFVEKQVALRNASKTVEASKPELRPEEVASLNN